jgi:arylsulfatase A-like enzyme
VCSSDLEYDDDALDAIRATYDAALADLDDATADLLADLDARGILANTVVILVADHGEQLGEDHRLGHRVGLNRALVHVPLVVSWPGHLAPRRVSAPVSTTGLPATVLGLLELPAPPGAGPGWLGPLPPRVVAETFGWDAESFARMQRLRPDLSPAPFARTYRAVQEGAWWLVESTPLDGGPPDVRLVDPDADPAERADLAADHPDVVAALRVALADRAATLPAAPTDRATGPARGEDDRRLLELLGCLEPADER